MAASAYLSPHLICGRHTHERGGDARNMKPCCAVMRGRCRPQAHALVQLPGQQSRYAPTWQAVSSGRPLHSCRQTRFSTQVVSERHVASADWQFCSRQVPTAAVSAAHAWPGGDSSTAADASSETAPAAARCSGFSCCCCRTSCCGCRCSVCCCAADAGRRAAALARGGLRAAARRGAAGLRGDTCKHHASTRTQTKLSGSARSALRGFRKRRVARARLHSWGKRRPCPAARCALVDRNECSRSAIQTGIGPPSADSEGGGECNRRGEGSIANCETDLHVAHQCKSRALTPCPFWTAETAWNPRSPLLH